MYSIISFEKARAIGLKIKEIALKVFRSIGDFFYIDLPFNNRSAAVKRLKKGKAIFVLGIACSGKNTFAKECLKGQADDRVIDADLEMEKIPEYQQAKERSPATAASEYHNQALKLKDALLDKTMKEGRDFIYLGSGTDGSFYRSKLEQVKRAYHVQIIYIKVSLDIALKRALARGALTKRVVPQEIIRGQKGALETNIDSYKVFADSFETYDNNIYFKSLFQGNSTKTNYRRRSYSF